jgi:DNA-binding transcriptional MerR regulator
MSEPTFGIAEVCAVVGITEARLHQWIERGQFRPMRETRPGIGREYTLSDAVHLAALVRLLALGMPVSRAAELIGTSPVRTAGKRLVRVGVGDIEVSINVGAIADTVIPRFVV